MNLSDSAFNCELFGNFVKAISIYKQLTVAYPNDDLSINSLAFCYMKADSSSQAIALYKKIYQLAKTKRDVSPTALEYLGICYTKMDSIPQAKAVFEVAIKSDYPLRDIPINCCENLADIYYKEKNYHKAISYYQMLDTLWRKAKFNHANHFAFKYRIAIFLSNCYKGLKLLDSAIKVQTPYMFCTYQNLKSGIFWYDPEKEDFKDSLKHDSICVDYLNLLKKRYSNKSIKKELKKAETNFQFGIVNKLIGKDNTFLEKTANASITFYNITATTGSFSELLKKDEPVQENYRKYFTKEYYLNYFHQMPVYKMILVL